LTELDDERFGQQHVHHALEALDRAGVRPLREHRAPERILSWIDAEFDGVWSSEAAASGAWWAEDKTTDAMLGFAAFDARGLAFHWLRNWRTKPHVGIFGPFGLVESARGGELGRVLLHASLFSLRERGYRQALIPVVGDERLEAYYERETGARRVETVAIDRPGRRWRTTVLASGNGSNFQAVLDAVAAGLPLDVTTLIANRENAFARERARAAGVDEQLVAWRRADEPREAYDARLLDAVAATEPELVLLLGWMHVLSASFVARFPQMLNIHPALLPLDPAAEFVTAPDFSEIPVFRGARALDDALAAGVGWAGASVHRVGVAVDRGGLMARAPLRLTPGEPRAALDERLHALEHRVLRAALRRWTWERP
jgi:phosphoribosylglycinamide formyltransferase-1